MTNSFHVTNFKDLDVTKVTFSPVKTYQNGKGQFVGLYYDGKPLRLQVPKMSLPFGVSPPYNNEGTTYHVDFSFGGDNPKVGMLLEKLREFDQLMVKTAVERSQEWFKKQKSQAVVEELYKSVVKESDKKDKNGNPYPAKLHVKLPRVEDDKFQGLTVYDQNQKALNVDTQNVMVEVPKMSQAKAIVQLSRVWFMAGGSFGLTANLVQMQVFKNSSRITSFAMQQDSDDEAESENEEGETEGGGTGVEKEVEDSDSSEAEGGTEGGGGTVTETKEVVVEAPKPVVAPTRGRKPAAGSLAAKLSKVKA